MLCLNPAGIKIVKKTILDLKMHGRYLYIYFKNANTNIETPPLPI